MSIKVYDLYRIPDIKSFRENIPNMVSRYESMMDEYIAGEVENFFINGSVLQFDRICYENADVSGEYDSLVEFLEDKREKHRVHMILMEHDGDHYVLFATILIGDAVRSFIDETITENSLINHEYWNNTDKPDDVTEKEWKHRLDIIESLAPDNMFIGEKTELIAVDRNPEFYIRSVPGKNSRCSRIVLGKLPYVGVDRKNLHVDFRYLRDTQKFVDSYDFSAWFNKLEEFTMEDYLDNIMHPNENIRRNSFTPEEVNMMVDEVIRYGKEQNVELFDHEKYDGYPHV